VRLDLFTKVKCQTSIITVLLGIKYSMHGVFYDVRYCELPATWVQ